MTTAQKLALVLYIAVSITNFVFFFKYWVGKSVSCETYAWWSLVLGCVGPLLYAVASMSMNSGTVTPPLG